MNLADWSGALAGALFGLFAFAAFGLVSVVAETLGRVLIAPARLASMAAGETLPVLIFFSVLFYAAFGALAQQAMKRRTWIAFVIATGLLVFLVILEALLSGLSA